MRRALSIVLLTLVPAQALAQSADGAGADSDGGAGQAPPPPLVIVEAPLPDTPATAVQPGPMANGVQPSPGVPFVPRVHRRTRPAALWAITAGSGAIGLAWVASIIGFFAGVSCHETSVRNTFYSTTVTTCSSPSGWLLVPLVGPWIALGGSDASSRGAGYQAALVIDGLTQVSGLAMVIVGIALRRPLAEVPLHPRGTASVWRLLPGAPGTAAGLSLTAEF